MKKPLISILTPVYNHEKFIAEAIEGVVFQTYQNWEMLIVDDCSTDGSWDIIQEYAKKDPRIRAFRNETNKGLILNWKFLIDNSEGEYIAFLEGDDVFYSHNLEEKIKVFEKYEAVGMVYCNFQVIDNNGDILIGDIYKKLKITTYKNTAIKPEEYLYSRINPFTTYGQIMIRRKILSISGYPRSFNPDEKVFLPSDWDFNFRVSTNNEVYFIDNILLGYRKHSGNSSSAIPKLAELLSMILDDYEKKFSGNDDVQKAIKYMRGKTHYAKVIFYLENSLKKEAWKTFFFYIKTYPANFFRDFLLNFKLIIRLFLPNKVNAYLKELYFNG